MLVASVTMCAVMATTRGCLLSLPCFVAMHAAGLQSVIDPMRGRSQRNGTALAPKHIPRHTQRNYPPTALPSVAPCNPLALCWRPLVSSRAGCPRADPQQGHEVSRVGDGGALPVDTKYTPSGGGAYG
jgi:hypothetical protein